MHSNLSRLVTFLAFWLFTLEGGLQIRGSMKASLGQSFWLEFQGENELKEQVVKKKKRRKFSWYLC